MQPQILLLKDGTESAGGKQQVISNINACQAIVDAVRTTLGPRGMDKLIVDPRVGKRIILILIIKPNSYRTGADADRSSVRIRHSMNLNSNKKSMVLSKSQ